MTREVPRAWGSAGEMSALEATMWRAEAEPLLRSGGVVVEYLDATPDWPRLVAGHEWAVRRVPRLRQRVIDDPLRLGPPAWADCPIDLAYHLRRTKLPPDEDLLGVAAALHMAPFDPARPLWEGLLVEDLPSGGAAYLLKLHHSLSDGLGVVQLLNLLHSPRARPTPDKPEADAAPLVALEPSQLAAAHAQRAARGGLGAGVRTALWALAAGHRAARAPARQAATAVRYMSSLYQVAGAAPAPPSPLLSGRGLSRRLHDLEAPADALRHAGRAADGTLNDAFLAALAGGLARYHARHGVTIDELSMALPVSMRRPDQAAGGNRFAGARISLPVSEPDVRRRIALVHQRVRAARDEPALDFLGLSAPLTSRLPAPVLTRLMTGYTRSLDLQASNFRGLNRAAYIAGARVERMCVFGPAPGCGLMATLVTHEGTCTIGLTIDLDAVTDPDGMVACLRDGLAEVLALAPTEAVA
jgi:WS/DGAT/MGAT family acyltransferase